MMLQMFVKQHYLVKETISKPTADGGTDKTTAYAMGARYALEVRSQFVFYFASFDLLRKHPS